MTTDDQRAHARLVALTRPAAGGPPGRRDAVPPDVDGAAPGAEGAVLREAAEQRTRRAVRAAATRYAADHGDAVAAAGRTLPSARRWAVTPRVALVALAALGLLAGAAVLRTLAPAPVLVSAAAQGPVAAATPADPDAAGGTAAAAPGVGDDAAGGQASGALPEAGADADVVVHVVGEVAAPGVVRLAAGERVVDAVEAAGGATAAADLGALNLARTLVDGEQVLVPAVGAPAPAAGEVPGGGSGAPDARSDARLDLNDADAAALDALPGIGPVLAERVVTWRTEHGRFTSVDELGEVRGIGPAVLDGLRDLVRV